MAIAGSLLQLQNV